MYSIFKKKDNYNKNINKGNNQKKITGNAD